MNEPGSVGWRNAYVAYLASKYSASALHPVYVNRREAEMKETRTIFMGIVLIAVVGLVSLNLSPSESVGCGGTEFSGAAPCSMAEFEMTMQEAEPLRVERKMCFRSLKAEGGVYAVRLQHRWTRG